MNRPCIHFISFRGDEFISAVRVFGRPDFFHRNWDKRAQQEIAPGDIAIFAKGNESVAPKQQSFDDSAIF